MKTRNFLVAILATATIGLIAAPLSAQGTGGPKNLFAQYYTQGAASSTHAGMYPAPHWVPRHVGHTYYTYQPLMPHEMMYPHVRNYYNYYAGSDAFYCDGCRKHHGGGGGAALNKTTVRWQHGHSFVGPFPHSLVPFQKLHYSLIGKRYCVGGRCGDSAGAAGGFLGGTSGHGGGVNGYIGGCETCDGGYGYSCDSCPEYGCGFGSNDSWAQKAAAATARLRDGRVQR